MDILGLERLLVGVLLILAILSFFPAAWHFVMMCRNLKGEQRFLSSFLGPFFILFPKFFTERGNYHRIRHGFFFLLFLGSSLVMKNLFLE